MALNTYSDLKTTIANYLGRSDLTAQIPDFITLAEKRLQRELRTRQMLKTSTLTMTSGDASLAIPSDFLEIRDIYIQGNPRITVSYMTPSAFTRDARAEDSGKPVFYTNIGTNFEFAPIPDSAYTVEMLYYYKPTELSDSNTTNIFINNYPDALLYGSLAQAEPYLMNDARITTWAGLYDSCVELIKTSDESSEYSGVPLEMKLMYR